MFVNQDICLHVQTTKKLRDCVALHFVDFLSKRVSQSPSSSRQEYIIERRECPTGSICYMQSMCAESHVLGIQTLTNESVSFERHGQGVVLRLVQIHCSERKLQDSVAWTGLWAAYLSKKLKAVFMSASWRKTRVLGHKASVTCESRYFPCTYSTCYIAHWTLSSLYYVLLVQGSVY